MREHFRADDLTHSPVLHDARSDAHVTDDHTDVTFARRKQYGGAVFTEGTASSFTSCTFEDNEAVRLWFGFAFFCLHTQEENDQQALCCWLLVSWLLLLQG